MNDPAIITHAWQLLAALIGLGVGGFVAGWAYHRASDDCP